MASIALATFRKPIAPCNRNVGASGRRAALVGGQGANGKPAASNAVERPGWKMVSTRPGTFGNPTAVKAAGVQQARRQSPKNGVPKRSVRCTKAAASFKVAAPTTTAVASGATPVPSPSSSSSATVFAVPAWKYTWVNPRYNLDSVVFDSSAPYDELEFVPLNGNDIDDADCGAPPLKCPWVNPRYSLDSVVFDGSAPYDELELVPLNGNDIDDAACGAPALDAGSAAASVAKFAPSGSMQLTTPFRAHRPISIFAVGEDDSRELTMEGQCAPVSRCESLPQQEDVIRPTQLERLQAMLALINNRKQ